MAITKSQNIIITGGARGIGRNVARYLLSRPENHQVYLLDLNAEELEYAVTQHLSAYAPRVGYAVVNLGKIDEVRAAVNKAADFFDGRIDVLVNNAGNSAHHMSWSDGG
jgi:NAD(P)-dependent dehydrogenase (short-subunit alcohol dehydrogenase family)